MAYKPIRDSQILQIAALSNSIGSSSNSTLDVVFAQIDSVLVNLAGLQMITNKTVGSSNAGLLSNTLQFQEIATPSTDPAPNTLALYPKSDGHFYSLNSSGTEVQVGSAGTAPVGSLQGAFLTLTQFQAQAGIGWVLAEGQTVPGSTYEALGILGGSSVTASSNSTANTTGATITFSTLVLSTTGTTHSNNQLTNVASVSGLAVGEIISGTSIPAATTVSSIDQYTFALPGTPDQYTFAVHSANQYVFTVSAASATAGSTYTNNGQTFTVTTTMTGATTLQASGTGNPLTSGTLTLASGSGDATITFSAYTFAGANASSGAVYSNNTQSFTVSTTIAGGTSLTAIGTGDPTASGTLTKTSGTGDSTIVFTSFTFGAHNATAGATYTNNGQTFTVVTTIDDGTTLVATGTGVPNSSGTLTKASGTGDATIPFSSVTANLTMSQAATASATITVDFSNFVTSTTGNLSTGSPTITDVVNTTGIATGQIISVSGISPYATVSSVAAATVPDCRGLVLRGQNNGRSDGYQDPANPALAAYESDTTAVNGLTINDPTHLHQNYAYGGNGSYPTHSGNIGDTTIGYNTSSASTGVYLSSSNAETRVKAIITNWFIRIN
jgi:hypothetical protein